MLSRTGFDRIEAEMALAYAQRPSGWPVGPEMIDGGGFYTPCPTVQLIEHRDAPKERRFTVYTFFPFRRLDRRYPPAHFATLYRARIFGFQRLRYAGDGTLALARPFGLDLARSGNVIGLEVKA